MTIHRGVLSTALTVGMISCGTPPPTVELTMEASLDRGRLRIAGTTDLRDGALLGYEVRHEDMNFDPETPIDMLFTEGTVTVTDGRYATEVDIRNFEPGEIEVWVAFQMRFINSDAQQPGPIVRQFGQHGELLEGANVTDWANEGKRVELTSTVHW